MAFPGRLFVSGANRNVTPLWLSLFCHERGFLRIVQWEKRGVNTLAFLSMEVRHTHDIGKNSKHCRFSSWTCWKMKLFRCLVMGWLLMFKSLQKIGVNVAVFKSYSWFAEACQWNRNAGTVQYLLRLISIEVWTIQLGCLFLLKSQKISPKPGK